MINFRKLIDLLPPYFRDRDSYKDENDKGLLERFLIIIGEEITDDSDRAISLLPNITNILDIIDVDYTRTVFLDYIFEFLGSPPQNYQTPTIEGEYLHQPPYYVWYLEYNIPLENFTKLGYKLVTDHKPIKHYSLTDRNLIKYAIALYKIRGTTKFYDILLKSYLKLQGYTLTEETLVYESNTKVRYDRQLPYDQDFKYDGYSTDCKACSSYIINLVSNAEELKPDEKIRLRKTLEKYSPINVELKVAYEVAIINVSLIGPEVLDGSIIVSTPEYIVVGYHTTVSISVESEIEFLGWYDDNDNYLSDMYNYTFEVKGSINLKAKYQIEL